MKKALVLGLLLAVSGFVIGQGRTLYRVNSLSPKAGMKTAFEESWKLHMSLYHKNSDKRTVYEIVSGPNNGSYVVVQGPISYETLDSALPNAKAHSMDLDKNLSAKLEGRGANNLLRWADTLSYNAGDKATKFLISVTVVKDGKLADYLAEIKRTVQMYTSLNAPYSFSTLVKMQSGSSPTVVTIRNLKNGYKELDAGYYNLPPNGFKDAYIKEFGQEGWDKRQKVLVDDIVSREQDFEVLRPDLSSK